MEDDDSDVQFEEEWEEVPGPQLPAVAPSAAAAAGNGDIIISLNADDEDAAGLAAEAARKKRPTARVYTKRDREDALAVHRAHSLCLLGHALLHDQAAADSELQGLLISLLPFDLLELASAAASSEDPTAKSWLPKLLHWFHGTFTVTAQNLGQQQWQRSGAATAGSSKSSSRSRRGDAFLEEFLGLSSVPVQQQLLGCVSARSGSSTQLSVLLVALLRAVGFLTRSVWSLDALPFKPAAVDALDQGKSIRATTAAAATAATAGRQSKATAGRSSRSRSTSTAAAAAAADDGASKDQANSSSKKGRGRGSRGSKAGGGGRGGKSKQQAAPAAAAEADGGSGPRKRRKGDEEFERELAMAMEATAAAEAASKQAGGSSALPPLAPKSNGLSAGRSGSLSAAAAAAGGGSSSGKKQQQGLASLISKGASPAELKKAAAAVAAAMPAGLLWQPRPGGLAAPKVWAEVYVGGSSTGRWLHVDGLMGCYDQPSVVEAAVVRRQPLSYVVACHEGAPKDVTRRYAANFTVNLKWRDDSWWSNTMAALRSSAAHLPRQLAAQVTDAAEAAEAAEIAAAIAAIEAAEAAAAAGAAGGGGGGGGAAGAAAGGGADVDAMSGKRPQAKKRKKQEEVLLNAAAAAAAAGAEEWSQQQQRKRQKQAAASKPTAKQPPSSDDEDIVITADKAAPAAAATAITTAAAAGSAGGVLLGREGSSSLYHVPSSANGVPNNSDAALRAEREEAELAARAAQQAAGPPTTVEGFKGHPLYVLQRHITKYQALRPGAVKLGLHKGEPYFARQDVQELHTRERWEREGRQVRPDEIDKPAKIVKKRALPAGGGGSGRSSRGGWGPWQRSNSTKSVNSDSAEPTAAAAAATAAADAAAAAAAGGGGGAGVSDNGAKESTQDATGEGEGANNMQQLYGLWQTEEFVRRAVDGKVPRNERGNVEVPPLAKSMPLGCKWIDAANVAPICHSLGIDYAPALVGFEVQGGRMVPRIRGVVVCEEHEQSVIELHIKREAEREAAALAKERREAAAAWRRLLNHMWTQMELQRKYGNNQDDTAAAAAAAGGAAAAGVEGEEIGAEGLGGSRPGSKDASKLKDVLGEMNAAAGGVNILQQASGAAAAAAAAAGSGGAEGGRMVAGKSADSAAGTGKIAARSGGGKVAAGRYSRELPPGVAPKRGQQSAQAGSHSAAAAAAAAAAGGSHQQGADGQGAEYEQPGTAEGQTAVANEHENLEGLEVEEF